jgi:hypothetical protein
MRRRWETKETYLLDRSIVSPGWRRSSLRFAFDAVPGSPALKLVPTSGRVIVLAAQSVRVNIYRRPD